MVIGVPRLSFTLVKDLMLLMRIFLRTDNEDLALLRSRV